MADTSVQNFKNHKTTDGKLVGAALGLLATLILGLVGAYASPYLVALAVAIGAASTIVLTIRVRAYAVRLQDRIVRLEMQLRLKEVLDAELGRRIAELSLSQLIGLRFASDAELPELMTQALDEPIVKADEIKKRVKDWQPDFLRV